MTVRGKPKTIVAAAINETYTSPLLTKAVWNLLSFIDPPIGSIIKCGDRVLVKVNMGCSGLRAPEDRVTSHPTFVTAIIEALKDCGAKVAFGDDVARVGNHCLPLWQKTGMWQVAKATGARLVDFVEAGAREVRGSLLYPRKYLVSKAYFEADVVVNAANCRSHQNIGMSGAVKNMFGFVVGVRKRLIHELFWDSPSKFGRAIADIHRSIPADLSILDMTTVREGAGIAPAVKPVGLLLASTDPVAVDTIAADAIGYSDLPIWTSIAAAAYGLGCNDPNQIEVRGLSWSDLQRKRLRYPSIARATPKNIYDRVSNFANHTLLRPRPVISDTQCTGCGDCAHRCPVNCIQTAENGLFRINLKSCADCGCCVKVCVGDAIRLEHAGLARAIHLFGERIKAGKSSFENLFT
jgi:uncharacterized protein (DUF362 family)/Pyruvate/2-oxoacid:ferredoxin oxidoreductase delta subunit